MSGERVFTWGASRWSESAAIAAAEGKEVVSVNIVGFSKLLGLMHMEPPQREIDFTIPIILGWNIGASGENYGSIPIDGWHRIEAAVAAGMEYLPTVLLTIEESEACRR